MSRPLRALISWQVLGALVAAAIVGGFVYLQHDANDTQRQVTKENSFLEKRIADNERRIGELEAQKDASINQVEQLGGNPVVPRTPTTTTTSAKKQPTESPVSPSKQSPGTTTPAKSTPTTTTSTTQPCRTPTTLGVPCILQ